MSIGSEQGPTPVPLRPRFRGLSGRALNRRVVMKAAAGVAAIAAAGGIGSTVPNAAAQDGSEWSTRSREWEPPQAQPSARIATQSTDEWQSFSTEFPFFAIGASWPIEVGLWPVIEVQLSDDGATWSETFRLAASNDGGGGPDASEQRLYTPLIHTYGSQYVRYRTIDGDDVPGEVSGLRFTYIDATDGPWEHDVETTAIAAETTADVGGDMRTPPEIVTRSGWGANENYRFDDFGEVWPPEYETVHHVIIHHTATPNTQDIPTAIRAIYYYHAITQGWGDIGYNYLVDRNGRIYEGRYGGQNVIGGHSFQYAIGSSGISLIGDFQNTPVPDVAVAGLVAITAWVGRDLDPYGTENFHEIPDLPIISAHRDVNQTTCPGNFLYNRLPEIRDTVAATLDAGDLETPFAGGFIPGDRVTVQTPEGDSLNVREAAGTSAAIVGSLANGTAAFVVDGPEETDTGNWYMVDAEEGNMSGWTTAEFLLAAPIPPPPYADAELPFGLNIYARIGVYVRGGPSLSDTVLMTAPRGMLGAVLNYPQTADGYEWYQIRWENGTVGWSAREFLLAAAFDESPAGQFDVGDTVEATTQIRLRPRPGIAQTPIATIATGTRLEITKEPVGVNDEIWYGVYSATAGGGWAVESAMRGAGAPPTGKFEIGDSIRVTNTMNLRSSSTTSSSVVAVMPAGTTGEVVGGPQTASGYTWWQLQTSLGTGWAAEDWLEETSTDPTPPVDGKFEIGERVYTTEGALRMRSAPGTNGSIITVLAAGINGTVVDGPRTGSGYTWWRIETSQGTGWVAENWLASSGAPDPDPQPGGKFENGEGVRVTENLNMRSGAGTGNGVVTVLPAGTTGTVIGGPSTGSGYTWWRIETSRGTGWVVENWIASTGTPDPDPDPDPDPQPDGKFEQGDQVRTTANLNMRSGASTSSGVISVLPSGTTGTVVGGPQTASGYTWWRIETSRGTGWVAEDWLVEDGGSGTPSGRFDIGEAVRVTENLNLRSGPGTGNSVITVLPAGTTGTVNDGPRTGSGYTWWRIETSRGTGWVVQDWIE